MRTGLLALVVALTAATSTATFAADGPRTRAEIRKSAEASLRLIGDIVINPDGTVDRYSIDKKEVVAAEVLQLMDKAVQRWRFEPVQVNGQIVKARTRMSALLVAKYEGERLLVRVADVHFGDAVHAEQGTRTSTDYPASRRLSPPTYPKEMLLAGGQGTAYLVVRFGRDGKVTDVMTQQVNLHSIGTPAQMDDMRAEFAKASERAARRWLFVPPTTGDEAAKDSWLVRVPVNYCIQSSRCEQPYGKWSSYIPGPRAPLPPWANQALKTAGAPDALPGNGIYPVNDRSPRLLTPLGG